MWGRPPAGHRHPVPHPSPPTNFTATDLTPMVVPPSMLTPPDPGQDLGQYGLRLWRYVVQGVLRPDATGILPKGAARGNHHLRLPQPVDDLLCSVIFPGYVLFPLLSRILTSVLERFPGVRSPVRQFVQDCTSGNACRCDSSFPYARTTPYGAQQSLVINPRYTRAEQQAVSDSAKCLVTQPRVDNPPEAAGSVPIQVVSHSCGTSTAARAGLKPALAVLTA